MFDKVSNSEWAEIIRILRPALVLSPNYIRECRDRLAGDRIREAVACRDSSILFNWTARLLARQGISNYSAERFIARHGSPSWNTLAEDIERVAFCPRLQSYWHYADCGYRRAREICSTPHHLVGCPVALVPARKGSLAEAAIGFRLFLRDVADGDLVGWIDRRLAEADCANGEQRLTRMRAAVLDPLIEIPGTGPKIWSMILAELLLGADPRRDLWVETGASFVAVDSLVHAFFHRTGTLQRLDASHTYGRACYEPGGCASVVVALARLIDAREFSVENPVNFPRFVQHSIWTFCAAGGWGVCNANRIDDRVGCRQSSCPSYSGCMRLPLARV